ncbi:ELWxxDGT repeat protein [Planctomycetaceae bacterium SH139]
MKISRRGLRIELLENRQLLAASPQLLLNIADDPGGSDPASFLAYNGDTYFVAQQTELWKTDGTTGGTELVKDLANGSVNGEILGLDIANNTIAIAFLDRGPTVAASDDRSEFWKSDGTTGGTIMVHDFGVGSSPESLYDSTAFSYAAVGNTLFFPMGNATSGVELWKSENFGTPTMVKDINPGDDSSYPGGLYAFGSNVLFAANNGANGKELWSSDGTTAGTVLVKDIEPGPAGSYPSAGYYQDFAELNGKIYFGALGSGSDGTPFNADDTPQFWSSDGTTAGTVLLKDFGTVPFGYITPSEIVRSGNLIFGSVSTDEFGSELWKSDGTAAGTLLVKNINPNTDTPDNELGSYPSNLTDVNGTLYFSASDGSTGFELWKSDGTEAGTMLVKDIKPASTGGNYGSYPYYMTGFNGEVYFTANDGTVGEELWKSDGTSAGTVLVSDINQSAAGANANIDGLAVANGSLFFSASDGTGNEPWVINAGIPLTDLTMRHPNGTIYVSRSTGSSFTNEKWTTWADVAWNDVQSGDFTGDNRADLLARHPNGSVYVARSSGNSFNTEKWSTWADVAWTDVLAGDFNGDGVDDVVTRHPDGRIYVAIADGNAFSTSKWSTWADVAWVDVKVGDFDGDGLDDLTMRHPNGSIYVARSTGSGFVNEKWLSSGTVAWNDVQAADFTGDGRTDLALRHPNGTVYVARSTGTGFVNEVWTVWADIGWLDVKSADFNGDGIADLTMRHPNGSVYVARSSGTNFVNEKWAVWADVAWADISAGDFNGDGSDDLSMRHPNGSVYVSSSTGTGFFSEKWTTWASIGWLDVISDNFVSGSAAAIPGGNAGDGLGTGGSGGGFSNLGGPTGAMLALPNDRTNVLNAGQASEFSIAEQPSRNSYRDQFFSQLAYSSVNSDQLSTGLTDCQQWIDHPNDEAEQNQPAIDKLLSDGLLADDFERRVE